MPARRAGLHPHQQRQCKRPTDQRFRDDAEWFLDPRCTGSTSPIGNGLTQLKLTGLEPVDWMHPP